MAIAEVVHGPGEEEPVRGRCFGQVFGRGQNAAIAFVRLKGWDERPGKDSSASALVKKANMAFFRIKQAMIFAINVPPIPELAAVGGIPLRLTSLHPLRGTIRPPGSARGEDLSPRAEFVFPVGTRPVTLSSSPAPGAFQ